MSNALKDLETALTALEVLAGPEVTGHLSKLIFNYSRAFVLPLKGLGDQLVLRGIDTNGTPAGIVTATLERLDVYGRFWVYNAAGTEMIGGPFLTEDAGWDAIGHRGHWTWHNTQFAESHIGAEHFAVVEKSESESLELLGMTTRVSTIIVGDLMGVESNGKEG